MLTDLAYSALTDVILACGQAFAAGLMFRPDIRIGSAAWLWACTLTLIAITFMLGAVDHGFFEPVEHALHDTLLIATRISAAVASFLICMTAAVQFLGPLGRKIVLAVSGAGNTVVIGLLLYSENFYIVMASYSAAMVLMLILSVIGLRDGRGSIAMIAGVVITFAASALPPLGYQGIEGLGIYATYHIALMPAVAAFYLGGLKLDRSPCRLGSLST